jgi:hypothetical protein
MNFSHFIHQYKNISAILLFLILYTWIMFIVRPSLIYKEDGSLRQFGIGIQSKTIIPAWLVAILLAILIWSWFHTSSMRI